MQKGRAVILTQTRDGVHMNASCGRISTTQGGAIEIFETHKGIEADERLIPMIAETVERLIVEEDVSYFYAGAYGGFDRLASAVVKEAKKKYPEITLMLMTPYHPAGRTIELTKGFDGIYYPEEVENIPKRYAIVRANRAMVDASDWLVAYVNHGASNACKLLEYARRRQEKGLIRIENLAEKN